MWFWRGDFGDTALQDPIKSIAYRSAIADSREVPSTARGCLQFPSNERRAAPQPESRPDFTKMPPQPRAIPLPWAQMHVAVRALAVAIAMPILGC